MIGTRDICNIKCMNQNNFHIHVSIFLINLGKCMYSPSYEED